MNALSKQHSKVSVAQSLLTVRTRDSHGIVAFDDLLARELGACFVYGRVLTGADRGSAAGG